MNPAARPDPSARRWVRLPMLIAAVPPVAARAQAERGASPSMNLAGSERGQLVIAWETPDPPPRDCRVGWANVHPDGGGTTLTLDNLTPGPDYKVQLRPRCHNEDRQHPGQGRPAGGTHRAHCGPEPAGKVHNPLPPPRWGHTTGADVCGLPPADRRVELGRGGCAGVPGDRFAAVDPGGGSSVLMASTRPDPGDHALPEAAPATRPPQTDISLPAGPAGNSLHEVQAA